jgi:hypothetical protein
MPDLILKSSGKPVFVPPERLNDALASEMFEAPDANEKVSVTLPGEMGLVGETTVGDLAGTQAQGAKIESEASRRGRDREARLDREHGGIIEGGLTLLESGLDSASFGVTGAIGDAAGGEEYRENRLERKEARPGLAMAGDVIGSVGPALLSGGSSAAGKLAAATPIGAATKLGARIAKTGEGASAATKILRSGLGGAVEGGLQGVGQTIQQLRDSDDPLSVERIGSALLSNVATNAGFGAAGNLVAAGAGKALKAAKGKLDDIVSRGSTQADGIADDLTQLDAKGLRQAEKVELEAIETSRVSQRAQVADEIKAHRTTAKDEKLFLATKDAKTWEGVDDALKKEMGVVGKRTLNADRQLDRLLDNPKALSKRPARALEALQQQEAALESLVAKRADLENVYKADVSKARAQALDGAERALQRNRELQTKLADLSSTPASKRLDDIVAARDGMGAGTRENFASKALGGAAFAGASGLAYESGLPGSSYLAPLIGAAAANAVTGKLGGKLASASTAAAKRASQAVDMFLTVGKKVAPAAPVLASRVFSAYQYASDDDKAKKQRADAPKAKLASSFRARADEVKANTTYVDGKPKARPEYRQRVAAQLAPIAQMSPVLADRLETLAARKMEFLSKKVPRKPEIGGIPTGPDRWQPSDLEMRSFARTMAAVEDPHGVIERLAHGTVSPEDAEAMREVYPEMLSDVTQQILERLPELQKSLPYERRLALSVFTGVPVDPAMDPRILRVLQASFTDEPGSEQGTQAPKPMPAFGSVKNQDATPSQIRQGG